MTVSRPDRFTDQVVLITGSAGGIGAVMAAEFAAEGAAVVIADIDEASAVRTAAGLPRAVALKLDVTDAGAVRAAIEGVHRDLGRIDVLINNAAVASDRPFLSLDEAARDRDVDVVLKGAFLTTQAVIPSMTRGAVILNIASVNALSYFGNEAYSAAKAGLVSLTRSIAVRYGPQGIRCNAIAPGTIITPIWEQRLTADPQVLDRTARWYPLGRIGQPADVAAAALFLCSAEAAWITGVCLPVDGGLMAGNAQMAAEITIADDPR